MKPMLKAPGTKRLKPYYDESPSTFAFEVNLRRYNKAVAREAQLAAAAAAAAAAAGQQQAARRGGMVGRSANAAAAANAAANANAAAAANASTTDAVLPPGYDLMLDFLSDGPTLRGLLVGAYTRPLLSST